MFEGFVQQDKPAAAPQKGGYFTVNIGSAEQKLPYIVFAQSDFEAARIVKRETGYMAAEHEVEGPYMR